MLEALVADKVWIGAAVFASLFVGERFAPASPTTTGRRRLVRNGALWLLLLLLSPLIVLPLTAFASDNPVWRRSEDWPAGAVFVADLLLLDLWAYWLHRAFHEFPVMWRIHCVHHLDRRLDTTSAVRFHPVEAALSALLRMAPIVLLAIPFAHVVIFETLLLAASLFHHSNLRLPRRVETVMSRLVVTPSIHWVHHHANRRDTNSNYAAVLSAWDRLFGTRSATERAPNMEIGLEGVEDKSVAGLLLTPFQPMEQR